MKTYQEMIAERPKKYASFMNCGSYSSRMTPFFDTVIEVERWAEENNNDNSDCYIRPVSNWKQVIANRNSYNCDPKVAIGE